MDTTTATTQADILTSTHVACATHAGREDCEAINCECIAATTLRVNGWEEPMHLCTRHAAALKAAGFAR